MKNKTGIFIGFVVGVAGFLYLFKIIFLVRIAPSDELAPGIVVMMAVCNGFVFGYLGSVVQNYLVKRKNFK